MLDMYNLSKAERFHLNKVKSFCQETTHPFRSLYYTVHLISLKTLSFIKENKNSLEVHVQYKRPLK